MNEDERETWRLRQLEDLCKLSYEMIEELIKGPKLRFHCSYRNKLAHIEGVLTGHNKARKVIEEAE